MVSCPSPQCANRVRLPHQLVSECYGGVLGQVLQLQAEVMTNMIQNPLDWVPTVTYNWVRVELQFDWPHDI